MIISSIFSKQTHLSHYYTFQEVFSHVLLTLCSSFHSSTIETGETRMENSQEQGKGHKLPPMHSGEMFDWWRVKGEGLIVKPPPKPPQFPQILYPRRQNGV